jgi:hypothetical protein
LTEKQRGWTFQNLICASSKTGIITYPRQKVQPVTLEHVHQSNLFQCNTDDTSRPKIIVTLQDLELFDPNMLQDLFYICRSALSASAAANALVP